MNDKTFYVSYFIFQQNNSENEQHDMELALNYQKQTIATFLEQQNNPYETINEFIEVLEYKKINKNNKWTQLEAALLECKVKGATLLIAELGNLTNNASFTQTLLNNNVKFFCCDQPFVNESVLDALCKHLQIQRKLHGKSIRDGLKTTSAKSGNPNAAEVIGEVNKPKIDAAIIFAFLLQPIIADYRRKGFSQRQMVKNLNDEGFTAPEGGKWVLSQLQKVLDRVRLNEIAIDARKLLEENNFENSTEDEIIKLLNDNGVTSIKRTLWDEEQVKKVLLRLGQIKEIELINKFVLDLLPIIHACRAQNLSTTEILGKFEQHGIIINSKATEVA